MSKTKQEPWSTPDTLEEARKLYADLEEQHRDVDHEAREMARIERQKPARLRNKYWIAQAENLYEAILEAQERLIARYGEAVKRPAPVLPESPATE